MANKSACRRGKPLLIEVHTRGQFPLDQSLWKWGKRKGERQRKPEIIKWIFDLSSHSQEVKTDTCNTLDVTSLRPWFSTFFFKLSHGQPVSVSFSKREEKQGLIHLNKRAVQPATVDLSRDSEEWDCISKEGHRERHSAGRSKKEEVYISAKSFCEQRHGKINKHYMCLILSSGSS